MDDDDDSILLPRVLPRRVDVSNAFAGMTACAARLFGVLVPLCADIFWRLPIDPRDQHGSLIRVARAALANETVPRRTQYYWLASNAVPLMRYKARLARIQCLSAVVDRLERERGPLHEDAMYGYNRFSRACFQQYAEHMRMCEPELVSAVSQRTRHGGKLALLVLDRMLVDVRGIATLCSKSHVPNIKLDKLVTAILSARRDMARYTLLLAPAMPAHTMIMAATANEL